MAAPEQLTCTWGLALLAPGLLRSFSQAGVAGDSAATGRAAGRLGASGAHCLFLDLVAAIVGALFPGC